MSIFYSVGSVRDDIPETILPYYILCVYVCPRPYGGPFPPALCTSGSADDVIMFSHNGSHSRQPPVWHQLLGILQYDLFVRISLNLQQMSSSHVVLLCSIWFVIS